MAKQGELTAPPPPQTHQLQNLHHKLMFTREPTPKLNSCIIPCKMRNMDFKLH